MKLKKLVGTILTGALLMTSGITAFAAVPDGSIIIHSNGFAKDVAYSTEYLDSELGSYAQSVIDDFSWTSVYFKEKGKIKRLKDNKILPNKDLRETVYFDTKKVMELENFLDIIMDNTVFSVDFVSEEDSLKVMKSFYPKRGFELGKKYKNNGIIGDCVANLANSNEPNLLRDSDSNKVMDRSDYPRFMNYYYTDTYEAGNGDKIK